MCAKYLLDLSIALPWVQAKQALLFCSLQYMIVFMSMTACRQSKVGMWERRAGKNPDAREVRVQQVEWLPHCNDLVSWHAPHLHSQTTRITITTTSATAIRAPMIPPTIPSTPLPAGVGRVLGVVGVFPLSTRKNISCHLFVYIELSSHALLTGRIRCVCLGSSSGSSLGSSRIWALGWENWSYDEWDSIPFHLNTLLVVRITV